MKNEEGKEPQLDGETTCQGVTKPPSPPDGHINGEWRCETTGWRWYDDIGE